jgi:hypothetical protein
MGRRRRIPRQQAVGLLLCKEPNTPESGTITLELKGLRLKGIYAQFDPMHPGDPLFVCKKRYL